jgi:hypothetical protein
MKKFLIAAALSAVAIAPAVASAQDPNPADFKNAAKFCKEFRDGSGKANFATMFGTKKNAYGKCVSQTAKKTAAEDDAQAKQARSQAVEECRAVKTPGSKNAFGKCVSEKAKAERAEQDEEDSEEAEDRKDAAEECDAERGETQETRKAFEEKYGTNGNKRNAFGKCVSQKAREA